MLLIRPGFALGAPPSANPQLELCMTLSKDTLDFEKILAAAIIKAARGQPSTLSFDSPTKAKHFRFQCYSILGKIKKGQGQLAAEVVQSVLDLWPKVTIVIDGPRLVITERLKSGPLGALAGQLEDVLQEVEEKQATVEAQAQQMSDRLLAELQELTPSAAAKVDKFLGGD